jgi:hypothetical protein
MISLGSQSVLDRVAVTEPLDRTPTAAEIASCPAFAGGGIEPKDKYAYFKYP